MSEFHAASSSPARQFDWTDTERPSHAIVTAVAAEEMVDPLDLEPLQGVVDTDALNALFRPADSSSAPLPGTVRFEYLGYEVVLDSRGGGTLYEAGDHGTTGSDATRRSISID